MPEGKNRSFGLNHGGGKGDADRTTDAKAYRENFLAINWGHQKQDNENTTTLARDEDGKVES